MAPVVAHHCHHRLPLIYSVYLGVAESARDIAVKHGKEAAAATITSLSLVGQMDTELQGARVAHNYMLEVVARNTPGAESMNDVMMGRKLVASPCHPRR